MALNLINAVVSKALFEAQIEVLENLKQFLASKEDVDIEFFDGLVNEFKDKLEADYKPPKGADKALKEAGLKEGKNKRKSKGKTDSDSDVKKKLSVYTMFIKYKMTDPEFKAQHSEVKNGKELMAAAVVAWQALSEDVKTQMKELYKENPEMNGEALYKQVTGGASTQVESVHNDSDADSDAPKPKEPVKKTKKASKLTKMAKKAETSDEE